MGKEKEFFYPAEDLFVKKGKTLQDIFELLGVSTTTLSKWKKKGLWDKKRKEYLTRTRTGPAQKLRDELFRSIEEAKEIDGKTVDKISKIVSAIEKIEGGRDILGSTIEVMDRFTNYIQANEGEQGFIETLTDHIHGFFNEVKKTSR